MPRTKSDTDKSTVKKTTTKKKTSKKKKEEIDLTGQKQKCMRCGKNLSYANFYKSKSSMYQGNNGIMCYCKDCLLAEYENFLMLTNKNEQLSIKFTCAKFSIPFVDVFSVSAVRESDNKRVKMKEEGITEIKESYAFGAYMKNLNSLGEKNGITQTEFDYFTNMALTDEENVTVDIYNDKARSLKVTDEMVEFWDGTKDRKKLYVLEKIWNEYATAYKISTPVHVKLFKECAFIELQSIEKRNKNINADVSDNTKKIKELLDSLKLLPKNKKDDVSDGADSCDGILVRAIENKHPIDNTHWKDSDNYNNMFHAIWRGHTLKNMGETDSNPTYANLMKEMSIDNSTQNNGGDN